MSAGGNLTRRLSQCSGLGLLPSVLLCSGASNLQTTTKGRGTASISQGLNPGELQSLGEGEHCDGGGLYLRVTGMGPARTRLGARWTAPFYGPRRRYRRQSTE